MTVLQASFFLSFEVNKTKSLQFVRLLRRKSESDGVRLNFTFGVILTVFRIQFHLKALDTVMFGAERESNVSPSAW